MHQSIPAVPIPPPGNRGAFAHVVIVGISVTQRDPRAFDTYSRKMDEFIGKDAAVVKDWLVRQGLEKLVDGFKDICFLIFINILNQKI